MGSNYINTLINKMKKLLIILFACVSIFAKSQVVATENIVSHGKWKFGGQVINVDAYNNKSVSTTWFLIDTITNAVIKTNKFTHKDTAFNTFWDNYNGFYSLYLELKRAENLPDINASNLEDQFYNKLISTLPKNLYFSKKVK